MCTSERVTGSEERQGHWDMVVQFVQATANALDILLVCKYKCRRIGLVYGILNAYRILLMKRKCLHLHFL